MEQAIKKAIEGGYKGCGSADAQLSKDGACAMILLDPLFWECLGKAEGEEFDKHERDKRGNYMPMPSWKFHWHRFIDHIAAKKPPETFFEALLTNK